MIRLPHPGIDELLDILPDAVLMVDRGSRIVYANPRVRDLLGHAPDALLGQPLSTLMIPAARERHDRMVARFQQGGAAKMMGSRPTLSALHRSGRVIPVSISICNLRLANDDLVSVAVMHDVSTLKTELDRATVQAETDALTGLGNGLCLSRRMQALLATDRVFALLRIDLQDFARLNQRHGRDAGDQALRVVGQRLRSQVRTEDLVVRVGSDEFVVLLDGLDDPEFLRARAQAIQNTLVHPLRIAPGLGVVGLSIGGAIRPRHGQGERQLLLAAARAMGLARDAGEGYRLAAD